MWASLLSGSIQERVDERASKYPIKERAELSWAGCEKKKGLFRCVVCGGETLSFLSLARLALSFCHF